MSQYEAWRKRRMDGLLTEAQWICGAVKAIREGLPTVRSSCIA
jgi:hypothetical protein